MITLSGLDVEPVELGQIINGATVHDDSGLGGLFDVAAPQLVHPSQQLVGRPPSDRKLEDETWLPGSETLLLFRRSPAELAESVTGAAGRVIDMVRDRLAEPCNPLVSDRRLDRFGAPAPGNRSRTDPYAEGKIGRAHV